MGPSPTDVPERGLQVWVQVLRVLSSPPGAGKGGVLWERTLGAFLMSRGWRRRSAHRQTSMYPCRAVWSYRRGPVSLWRLRTWTWPLRLACGRAKKETPG